MMQYKPCRVISFAVAPGKAVDQHDCILIALSSVENRRKIKGSGFNKKRKKYIREKDGAGEGRSAVADKAVNMGKGGTGFILGHNSEKAEEAWGCTIAIPTIHLVRLFDIAEFPRESMSLNLGAFKGSLLN